MAYRAFISYKHDDREWATWLQEKIEYFNIPEDIQMSVPDVIDKLRPIFRDETDLELGFLNENIHRALDESAFLIVICSPRALLSKYVEDEIRYFISIGREKSIIPFIVDGIPCSPDSRSECFPLPIRELTEIPLAANVNELSKDYAAIKVISRLLDVEIGSLWKRYLIAEEQDRQKKIEERNRLLRFQSKFLSEKAISLLNEGDIRKARLLALEAIPHNIKHPDRPLIKESEYAVRALPPYQSAIPLKYNMASAEFVCDDTCVLTHSNVQEGSAITLWKVKNGEIVWSTENSNIDCWRDYQVVEKFGIVLGLTLQEIVVFNLGDGSIVKRSSLQLKHWFPEAVQIDAEGKHIAISSEQDIYIMEYSSLKIVSILHIGADLCKIRFSPDGKFILLTTQDGIAQIWSIKLEKCIDSHYMKHRWCDVRFIDDGKSVIVANSKDLYIWHLFSAGNTTDIQCPFDSVSLRLSGDGKYAVSLDSDNSVSIIDIDNGSSVNLSNIRKSILKDPQLSSGGKYLFCVEGYTLFIQSIKDENEIRSITVTDDLYYVIPHPIKQEIAVACGESLKIIDWGNGRVIKEYQVPSLRICFDALGTRAVTTSEFTPAYLIDYENEPELIEPFTGQDGTVYYPTMATFNHTGDKLLINAGGISYVWDILNKRIEHKYDNFADETAIGLFSIDDSHLVIATGSVIEYYDAVSAEVIWRRDNEPDFRNILLPSNGKTLITIDSWKISIIDIETGTIIKEFNVDNPIWGAGGSLSDDGALLVTWHEDYIIRIWDIASSSLIQELKGHSDHIRSVFFLNGNEKLVSCDYGGNIKIWSFPSLQEVIDARLAEMAGDSLTELERKDFYLD